MANASLSQSPGIEDASPALNRPSIGDLLGMPLTGVASLPVDVLALLQTEADDNLSSAKAIVDRLHQALGQRFGERAAAARAALGKDNGTVRLVEDGITIVSDLSKRVEWDQPQLAAMVERIRAAGEEAGDYIDVTYKVSERRFAAWPPAIRDGFEPARTVRTGKPRIRLMREESC